MSQQHNTHSFVTVLPLMWIFCLLLCSCHSSSPAAGDISEPFRGNCGISATANFGFPIMDVSCPLSITVSNTSGKEISAVTFCILAYDTNSNILPDWIAPSLLKTTAAIGIDASVRLVCRYPKFYTATVKVYICNVQFSDGSQWGNPTASLPTLHQFAIPVCVYENS